MICCFWARAIYDKVTSRISECSVLIVVNLLVMTELISKSSASAKFLCNKYRLCKFFCSCKKIAFAGTWELLIRLSRTQTRVCVGSAFNLKVCCRFAINCYMSQRKKVINNMNEISFTKGTNIHRSSVCIRQHKSHINQVRILHNLYKQHT